MEDFVPKIHERDVRRQASWPIHVGVRGTSMLPVWLAMRNNRKFLLLYEDVLQDPEQVEKMAAFLLAANPRLQRGGAKFCRTDEGVREDTLKRLALTRDTRQDQRLGRRALAETWKSALPSVSVLAIEEGWEI